MEQVAVKFADGSARRYPRGTTLAALAAETGRRDILAARVDGAPRDLAAPLERDAAVEWLTFGDPAGREIYWHSTAHLLAQAVRELFPQAKLAIGPPIEDGFYYDFDIGRPFTPEDLEAIEAGCASWRGATSRSSGSPSGGTRRFGRSRAAGKNTRPNCSRGSPTIR